MIAGYEENEWSDYESDEEILDYPDWFVEEELYFSRLRSINKFKQYMEKEIYGVSKISDIDLLLIIESADNCTCTNMEYEYDRDIMDDLWLTLFKKKESLEVYDNVFRKIYKKCFIY